MSDKTTFDPKKVHLTDAPTKDYKESTKDVKVNKPVEPPAAVVDNTLPTPPPEAVQLPAETPDARLRWLKKVMLDHGMPQGNVDNAARLALKLVQSDVK